jgi:hypothetical protein
LSDPKQNLRLDKRLIRRRGWIPAEELRRELDALPDVSDKVQPPEEPGDAAGAGAPAGGSTGGA